LRLSHEDVRGKGQTVLGLIDPIEFGPTLLHEHLICDIRPPSHRDGDQYGRNIELWDHWQINYGEVQAPGNWQLDNVDVAIEEVNLMLAEGGSTIVDLTCGGINPKPSALKAVAESTGAHIVMGCGHYVDEYQQPDNRQRSVDSFAAEIIGQVFEGAWGSDIRSGIIGEIGCQSPWTDLEKTVMEAAVIAMAETGASLNIHPGRHPDQPQEIVDFLSARHVDLTRVIISHVDRTIFDQYRLFRLADSGVVIELDHFGMENSFYEFDLGVDMPNDAVKLRIIRSLLDRGHVGQVAVSQDICTRARLRRFGGHGYGHIFRNIRPYMLRRNFSEAEIDEILIATPRRLLTFV